MIVFKRLLLLTNWHSLLFLNFNWLVVGTNMFNFWSLFNLLGTRNMNTNGGSLPPADLFHLGTAALSLGCRRHIRVLNIGNKKIL